MLLARPNIQLQCRGPQTLWKCGMEYGAIDCWLILLFVCLFLMILRKTLSFCISMILDFLFLFFYIFNPSMSFSSTLPFKNNMCLISLSALFLYSLWISLSLLYGSSSSLSYIILTTPSTVIITKSLFSCTDPSSEITPRWATSLRDNIKSSTNIHSKTINHILIVLLGLLLLLF